MHSSTQSNTTSKFYHIILKASKDQSLFKHDTDYRVFLKILTGKQQQYAFQLYAYCLLNTHIHLLIEEKHKNSLPIILRTTSALYEKYYKKKYHLHDILFISHYQRENILLKKELICRLRYIHQQPKVLGFTKGLKYSYSSYQDYLEPNTLSILNKQFIYTFFHPNDTIKASRLLSSIHHEIDHSINLHVEDHLYYRVKKAKEILFEELTAYQMPYEHLQISTQARSHLIRRMYQESELTQQEIGDLLSLSRHIVGRAIRCRDI